MGVKFTELHMASLNLHLMPDGTYAKRTTNNAPAVKKTASTSKEKAFIENVNGVMKINIKPMSVNEAWFGKKIRTEKHRQYEKTLLTLMPDCEIPNPPFKISYEFGLSNRGADLDNNLKIFQDVLTKRYGFDDKLIHQLTAKKVIVNRGEEYILWQIESII